MDFVCKTQHINLDQLLGEFSIFKPFNITIIIRSINIFKSSYLEVFKSSEASYSYGSIFKNMALIVSTLYESDKEEVSY